MGVEDNSTVRLIRLARALAILDSMILAGTGIALIVWRLSVQRVAHASDDGGLIINLAIMGVGLLLFVLAVPFLVMFKGLSGSRIWPLYGLAVVSILSGVTGTYIIGPGYDFGVGFKSLYFIWAGLMFVSAFTAIKAILSVKRESLARGFPVLTQTE
jgi:hypothetical protein